MREFLKKASKDGGVRSRGFRLVLAALVLCAGCVARAQEDEETATEESWESYLIRRNIAISKFFDGMADGLDLFLAGERITTKRNDTSIRVDNSTYVKEGEGVSNFWGVGVNLRLPNLEKYWSLKFTSFDEQEERRSVRQNYMRQNPRERNYGATVGLFQKLGDVRTSFEPRIELQDPLKISHSITFDSVADMKTYEINPKLELFATPTKGTGTFTALNINIPFSRKFSLTLINEGEYQDKIHTFSASNGFSVGHVLSYRSTMSYDLIFGSNNRPSYHLENYVVGATWSRLIYKKILNFRTTPYVDFQKSRGFKGQTGFTFTVSLIF